MPITFRDHFTSASGAARADATDAGYLATDAAGATQDARWVANNTGRRPWRVGNAAGRGRSGTDLGAAGATGTAIWSPTLPPAQPDYDVKARFVRVGGTAGGRLSINVRATGVTASSGYDINLSGTTLQVRKQATQPAGFARAGGGGITATMAQQVGVGDTLELELSVRTVSGQVRLWGRARINDGTWVELGTSSDPIIDGSGSPLTATGRPTVEMFDGTTAPTDTDGPHLDWFELDEAVTQAIGVACAPASLTIQPGASATTTLTFDRIGGYAQGATLSLEGAPTGTTVGWGGANPIPAGSGTTTRTVTVTLDPGVARQTYALTVRAVGTGVPDATTPLTVVVPAPTITRSQASLTFTGLAGGAAPAGQTVSVTNGGTGTLDGLSASVAYGAGATGWLTPSLSSTTAPATLTLTPSTTGLQAGTYTATVTIASTAAGVTNSPQTVAVTLTVTPDLVFAVDGALAAGFQTLSGGL